MNILYALISKSTMIKVMCAAQNKKKNNTTIQKFGSLDLNFLSPHE